LLGCSVRRFATSSQIAIVAKTPEKKPRRIGISWLRSKASMVEPRRNDIVPLLWAGRDAAAAPSAANGHPGEGSARER
jgi:hypothetical protein